jgi:hypothetical protein
MCSKMEDTKRSLDKRVTTVATITILLKKIGLSFTSGLCFLRIFTTKTLMRDNILNEKDKSFFPLIH